MKVLLTSTDNPYTTRIGGKHIHLLLLERGLKNLNVEVATLYYKSNSIIEMAKKGMWLPLSEKQQFKRKIGRKINYLSENLPRICFDVIHAHDVLSMLAVRRATQKKVLTLHGYFARENIEFIKSEKERERVYPFLFETEKEGIDNANHIITVDQRLKDYILAEFNYPPKRVTVVYNAVDTDTFRPVSKDEQNSLKVKSGFKKDDFIILVPRRLVEKNGVIYAVRAMKHVANEKLKLIIAGDGPERQKILAHINGDTRIKILGVVPHDQIVTCYMMADSVLIPSVTTHGIQEATSVAMLEGMACGKIVVCSGIGGMREVVEHMKNGILIEEKEPEEIAKAIRATFEDPLLMSKLSHNARKYILKNHSYLAHAKKVLSIYEAMLER